MAVHKQERDQTDTRKLVRKPLAKHYKEHVYSDRLQAILTGAGLEGGQSVGFSPDKYPGNPRSGVVGFVVFVSVEQRVTAITWEKAAMTLMDTAFQMEGRIIRGVQKGSERNLTLDRLKKNTVAHATGKETTEHQGARREGRGQGA